MTQGYPCILLAPSYDSPFFSVIFAVIVTIFSLGDFDFIVYKIHICMVGEKKKKNL